MIEGMYTAAAGMAAQQVRLDAVANDLANANTTAYKSNRVAFRDLLYQKPGLGAGDGVMIGSGSAAASLGRNMTSGSIQQTQRPLDIALQGPGFISVTGLNGKPALTRDGNLAIDSKGRLTLSSGEILSPTITLPKGVNESGITIGSDGVVRANKKVLGTIKLVEVRSPGQLQPGANNTFTVGPESGAARKAASTTIVPASLEMSNTDAASSMVAMIEAQRAFQLASRAIKIQDQSWEIANQVKR